jgi:hypothetical protein
MRTMEQRLKDAVRSLDGKGVKPVQKRARRPSAMEKKLMAAKKAFKKR